MMKVDEKNSNNQLGDNLMRESGFHKFKKTKIDRNDEINNKTFRELSNSCILKRNNFHKKSKIFNESYNMKNILSPSKNLNVDLLCFEYNVKISNAKKKKNPGEHDFNIISNVSSTYIKNKDNEKNLNSTYKPLNIVEIGKNEEKEKKIKVKRYENKENSIKRVKQRQLFKQEEDHIIELYSDKEKNDFFVDKISNKDDGRILNKSQKNKVIDIVADFSNGKFSAEVLLKKLKDNNVVSNSIEVRNI